MALMSYKCPNCGRRPGLYPSQKFQCEYCLSEFTEEKMKQMEEASASPAEEEEAVPEEEGTAPQEGDSSQSPETRGKRPFTPVPTAGPRSSRTPPRRLPSAITAITRWSFPAAFRETICRTLSSPLP